MVDIASPKCQLAIQRRSWLHRRYEVCTILYCTYRTYCTISIWSISRRQKMMKRYDKHVLMRHDADTRSLCLLSAPSQSYLSSSLYPSNSSILRFKIIVTFSSYATSHVFFNYLILHLTPHSYRITSPHIITPHQLTSHHTTSRPIVSHHTTPHLVPLPHTTSHHTPSLSVPSRDVDPRRST